MSLNPLTETALETAEGPGTGDTLIPFLKHSFIKTHPGSEMLGVPASEIKDIKDVKLSANWMCAAGAEGEDENLYRTVEAVGMEFCPALGITIPVGKDSMSMRTAWKINDEEKSVTAPLSLIITGFSPVLDVRKTLTPELRHDQGNTRLILLDLGAGANRMGGSILAQVYNQLGDHSPDVDSAEILKNFFMSTWYIRIYFAASKYFSNIFQYL